MCIKERLYTVGVGLLIKKNKRERVLQAAKRIIAMRVMVYERKRKGGPLQKKKKKKKKKKKQNNQKNTQKKNKKTK
eukprot:NODE_32236_length_381_cov_0.834646.p3 GENE.NODE_32236_length_381_cov_0.834646~~NODE_32236_length_381_cov_0.834646.p3  ORF type:complete len:76 (-),score=27.63 NODE_32236_length_381_cov_0.834646:77-304(-)